MVELCVKELTFLHAKLLQPAATVACYSVSTVLCYRICDPPTVKGLCYLLEKPILGWGVAQPQHMALIQELSARIL